MTMRNWIALIRLIALAIVLGLAGVPAGAAVVTYRFTGTATTSSNAGDTLTGTFSYDTSTPGSGLYPIPNAEPFRFSFGSRTGLTAFVGDILIRDEALSGGDRLALGGPLPPGGVFPTGFTLILDLLDSTRTAFISNALTETLPPASAFDTTSFQIREFISGIQILNASGTISSLTRVIEAPGNSVPVPPTLLLLLAGGCAAIVRFRASVRDPKQSSM